MNRLEDFIRNNRNEFNDAEPPDGHLERFSKNLKGSEKKSGRLSQLHISLIWRAAAVVLVLLAVSVFYTQFENSNLFKISQGQNLPAELIEATNYYNSLAQEKLELINELSEQDTSNSEILSLAESEIKAITSNSEDLKENYLQTRDERVMDAIITNYRLLGDLLDHIIIRVVETRQ